MSRRRVTLSDVAKRAGVSTATASFVLSGRDGQPGGSPAARQRVQRAAADLDYRPNQHARAMRTGRTGAIALALGDSRDPWMGALAQRVNAAAQPAELSTVVLVDETWYDFLQGHEFDCSFLTGVDFTHDTRAKATELGRQGHRLVVFSELIASDDFDVIASLRGPSIGKAYRRLRERHDRVHLLATSLLGEPDPPLRSRRQLFLDAVADAGDDPEGLVLTVAPMGSRSRNDAQEWLSTSNRPTAVIAQTGFLALALQAAALHLGIDVPGELEIISIGEVPEPMALMEPVSFYGVPRVFDRIAEVVVHRARADPDTPVTRTELEWSFHEGATTR